MNKLLYILVLIGLSTQTLQAQRYSKRKIRKDLEELPGFQKAYVGLKVTDKNGPKFIIRQNDYKYMTPGSTAKLFTIYGGMNILPDTLAALEYEIKGDSLIFWSTGYPLSLHPEHPDNSIINLLSKTDKKLVYWPRPTEDERFGPGWGWDDYPYYFGAEKSVLPLFGNSVRFILDNQDKTFEMNPNYRGFQTTIDSLNADKSWVSRDEFWNEFSLKFSKTTEKDTITRAFHTSEALSIELLSQAIGKPISIKEKYQRPDRFYQLEGILADSLYRWTLQDSDNLFAEQILLMISGEYSDTLSTEAAIKRIQQMSKSMEYISQDNEQVWVDGSGLSRYNMFSPRNLESCIFIMERDFGRERILSLLPRGKTSGTLEDWYGPYVYAKTGTLSNNHALVGFIHTKKGKWLTFSFMVNHYTAPTKTIRESMGVVLKKIYEAY